jgi:hypothetical protein
MHGNSSTPALEHLRARDQKWVITRRIGTRAERRFAKICRRFLRKGGRPAWLLGIVSATNQEDLNGADFFAETVERYRIPIDVKASEMRAQLFKMKLRRRGEDRSHVIILVVNDTLIAKRIISEFEVWCEALGEISIKRLELLAKRAATE